MVVLRSRASVWSNSPLSAFHTFSPRPAQEPVTTRFPSGLMAVWRQSV
jgi:hypothetical protein